MTSLYKKANKPGIHAPDKYSFVFININRNMITRLHAVDGITLDFDPSVPYLLATYTGFVTSKDFRNHCEDGVTSVSQKVAEHGKVAWLSDLRKSEIFNEEDVKWCNEYWNVQVHTNGLQYFALVMAESAFAAINIEEYLDEHKRRKEPLVIKLFSDMESAATWCKEMVRSSYRVIAETSTLV